MLKNLYLSTCLGYKKNFSANGEQKDPYKFGAKANPDLVKDLVRASEYFKILSDGGKSEDEIFKILSTEKHVMRIFTWRGPIDTQMSVIDSIKYIKKILPKLDYAPWIRKQEKCTVRGF